MKERALAQATARVGQIIDAKYRITAVLALGGMGVVYQAEHQFLGRKVALKVLHPRYEDGHEAAKRFLREALTLGTIEHRAIVEVLDGGFVDGTTPYLVMEHLAGENLAQRIQRRKALRLVQAVTVLREMLKGLAAAHAKGVVHCDLKPENVFLVDHQIELGTVKLLDFGVARIVGNADMLQTESGVVDPHRLYGTPEYMAPEQIVGEPLDARTDLYGAGVVIYESLTGQTPFGTRKDKRPVVFGRILRDRPPRLIGQREPVPAWLSSLVVDQLLAKHPQDRPESAQEVLRLLDDQRLVPTSIASMKAVKPV
jgi:serine/threonine-protein kinase